MTWVKAKITGKFKIILKQNTKMHEGAVKVVLRGIFMALKGLTSII